MTGENEHERDGAGDEPAPESAEASAGGSVTPESAESPELSSESDGELRPSRRFRSWVAAEEQKPSVLSRLRKSIGAVFRSQPKEERPPEESPEVSASGAESDAAPSPYEGESSPDDRPWMEPRVVEDEPANEPASTQGAIPWIDVPEAHVPAPIAEAEPVDDAEPEPRGTHFGGDFFEAPTEIIPEKKEPEPGFFSRLFGRKSKSVPAPPAAVDTEPLIATNEYSSETAPGEIEAAFDDDETADANPVVPLIEPVESSFSSVDEALPVPAEPPPAEPFVLSLPEQEEGEPGFFSRLIGRKSRKVEKKERPSLEIEIHEDRIAAAADAIDQMQETPASPESPTFASFEDALPERTGDERFAPPPAAPVDSRPSVEAEGESRSTVELDFGKTMDAGIETGKAMDIVAEDDTLEVNKKAPKPSDMHMMFGNTLELPDPKPRSGADSGAYFGDTLEPSHFGDVTPPEEIDKDTDEFAVPLVTSAEQPSITEPMDLDEDTAQVSRKSLLEKLLFWRKEQEEKAALDGSQTVVEGNPNFLFSKFRTFYNEIIRHKHQKTEFTAGFSTAIVTEYTADLSPEGAADTLSKNLAAMLELQAAEATWMGGESAQRYPDAQYAMAALADETFLHQEWEGKGAWHRHLLEVKMFRSRSADVELFKRIDKLLKDQPNSPAARDLARVYLMVIAAGFKGKYRMFGLSRPLAEYRQRLYEFIHHGGDALMIYAPERRIFPEATERTLVGHAIGKTTSAQRWAAILAFLLISYTAIAHVAWSRLSADLKDVTGRIKATSTTVSGNGGP